MCRFFSMYDANDYVMVILFRSFLRPTSTLLQICQRFSFVIESYMYLRITKSHVSAVYLSGCMALFIYLLRCRQCS